jgi:hypothetical protein
MSERNSARYGLAEAWSRTQRCSPWLTLQLKYDLHLHMYKLRTTRQRRTVVPTVHPCFCNRTVIV